MRPLRAELLRLDGRRGSMIGAGGATLLVAVLIAAFGDRTDAATWNLALGFPLSIGAVVLGSLAGSGDAAAGTMRYLVITGTPRWQLLLARLPVLVIAVALALLPAALVAVVKMLIDGRDDALLAMLGVFLAGVTWAFVGTAIGTLLRSNAGGIAVALALQLGGVAVILPVLLLLGAGESVNALLPLTALDVGTLRIGTDDLGLTGVDSDWPLWLSGVITAAWVVGLLGLAMLRFSRDEY